MIGREVVGGIRSLVNARSYNLSVQGCCIRNISLLLFCMVVRHWYEGERKDLGL